MLRLNLDDQTSGHAYKIVSENPFVGRTGRDEICASGMRSPWRMTCDEESGKIFVGDVGQYRKEEIDLLECGNNYGWPIMEYLLDYGKSGKLYKIVPAV